MTANAETNAGAVPKRASLMFARTRYSGKPEILVEGIAAGPRPYMDPSQLMDSYPLLTQVSVGQYTWQHWQPPRELLCSHAPTKTCGPSPQAKTKTARLQNAYPIPLQQVRPEAQQTNVSISSSLEHVTNRLLLFPAAARIAPATGRRPGSLLLGPV